MTHCFFIILVMDLNNKILTVTKWMVLMKLSVQWIIRMQVRYIFLLTRLMVLEFWKAKFSRVILTAPDIPFPTNFTVCSICKALGLKFVKFQVLTY